MMEISYAARATTTAMDTAIGHIVVAITITMLTIVVAHIGKEAGKAGFLPVTTSKPAATSK